MTWKKHFCSKTNPILSVEIYTTFSFEQYLLPKMRFNIWLIFFWKKEKWSCISVNQIYCTVYCMPLKKKKLGGMGRWETLNKYSEENLRKSTKCAFFETYKPSITKSVQLIAFYHFAKQRSWSQSYGTSQQQ